MTMMLSSDRNHFMSSPPSSQSGGADRVTLPTLTLQSTLADLMLHHQRIDVTVQGRTAKEILSRHPSLPGILLFRHQAFVGMISRQQFFSRMSQPYSLELFLKRSIEELLQFIEPDPLLLPHDTPIHEAAQRSLQRPTEYLHEPIVVQYSKTQYALLDIHQLLLAQAEIHRLTTVSLHNRTQDYLCQTEKMSMLGQTIAGVSHEMKSPVNCISGNIEFLKIYVHQMVKLLSLYKTEYPEGSDRIRSLEADIDLDFVVDDIAKMMESIDLSSGRLVNIVSSLRNFSRFDRERKEAVDIHTYLDGTLLILNSYIKQGITIVKDYGDIPKSLCYPGQISQVFMNLISNSVDALLDKQQRLIEAEKAQGKTIEQSHHAVSQRWQPRIKLATGLRRHSPQTSALIIQVSDNADGIPETIQARIFEPFFTTKAVEKGTGLGLAITRQIIERHNGKIVLNSRLGKGTVFKIVLPFSLPQGSESEQRPPAQSPTPNDPIRS